MIILKGSSKKKYTRKKKNYYNIFTYIIYQKIFFLGRLQRAYI